MRQARRVVVLGVVTVLAASVAAADPIVDMTPVFTSGQYVITPDGEFFRFVGANMDLHQTSGIVTPKITASTCTTCTPGDIVNLSWRTPPLNEQGFTQHVELGTGHGTISGQTHPFLSFFGSPKFNATPVVFPNTNEPFVTLETPFSFRAWLEVGFEPGPFTGGIGMRRAGVGIATASFVRSGTAYIPTGNVTFEFKPVPEPSSLLLFGTGMAALGRAGWKRARRSR